ncbi:MAG: nucleotide exchange factor GrpE [Patescibacteria group bacterium]
MTEEPADLQKQLDECRAQAEEYLGGWKRAKADMVNYQRQVERERGDWAIYAQADTVQKFLPVIDSLEAAMVLGGEHASVGMRQVYEQCLAAFKECGVESIDKMGEPPNPEYHEVVAREKSDAHAQGLITKVVQKGYTLRGRLLRPARVIISE